jgi:DNA-binding NtrC family response regulator
LLAQSIAEASARRPIVRAVLGSSDDLNTITSELFGHERGAFSGATSKRVGLVEYANGGTLLLDEILNLPLHAQQLLLDFTQFGTYRPLGYDRPEPKRATVRLIAATNGNLRAAIREGRFREDLYYRLAAVTLDVPPLRERREDIPGLVESTLRRVDAGRVWGLSLALRRSLLSPANDWAGNVRQLERAVERARERAVARDPEATVLLPEHFEARDLGAPLVEGGSVPPPAHESLQSAWQKLQSARVAIDEKEKDVIARALESAGGVVAHAARALGIARTTLASRIDALGTRPPKRDPKAPTG